MPTHADRAPLSRERVLTAALAIADAEGPGSLTMRRVAAVLACEAMSLYHHVADKKALLSGPSETVVDEVLANRPPTAAAQGTQDWRESVRARCLGGTRCHAPTPVGAGPCAPQKPRSRPTSTPFSKTWAPR